MPRQRDSFAVGIEWGRATSAGLAGCWARPVLLWNKGLESEQISKPTVEERDNGSCICFLWKRIPLCDICRLRRELGGVHWTSINHTWRQQPSMPEITFRTSSSGDVAIRTSATLADGNKEWGEPPRRDWPAVEFAPFFSKELVGFIARCSLMDKVPPVEGASISSIASTLKMASPLKEDSSSSSAVFSVVCCSKMTMYQKIQSNWYWDYSCFIWNFHIDAEVFV